MNLEDALGGWPPGASTQQKVHPTWPGQPPQPSCPSWPGQPGGGGGGGGAWPGQPGQPGQPGGGGGGVGTWPGQPGQPGQPGGGGAWPGQPGGGGAWPGQPGQPGQAGQPGGRGGGGGVWPGQPGQPGQAGQPGGRGGCVWPGQPGQPGQPGGGGGPGPGPAQKELNILHSKSLPRGVYDKLLITIVGTINPTANRLAVDMSTAQDVAFHLNPRFNERGRQVIVRNSCINKAWGCEERDGGCFPFVHGKEFEMKILCTNKEFKVAVDNSHLLTYRHRIDDLRSITKLHISEDLTLKDVRVETVP